MKRRVRSLIHGPSLVLMVFLIMALGRLLSLLIPTEFYFTFQSLFSDRPSRTVVLSLLLKMSAPLLASFISGYWLYRRGGGRGTSTCHSFYKRLRVQWMPTFFLAGFSAAFLSAWPIIVYWDLLSNPEIGHLKLTFFGIYALYMFAFGYITLMGLLAAVFVGEHLDEIPADEKMVSKKELGRVGALWLINSGIATSIMGVITK
ncbi:hypothetical protein [Rugamonas aquatica]|uniref:Uncharacterized protein n=1 Tax=Rugamonas aquatica TaxID=2743357 RepID=A0A6A7N0P9_9BURK|nr:hypothetical protein [Rugamonas aquatica]MQA38624.1 hypothetical protein [Rugamonas aquatica]